MPKICVNNPQSSRFCSHFLLAILLLPAYCRYAGMPAYVETIMRRTPSGENFTDLILETFRLNGDLIPAGNHLVKDLGLTGARRRMEWPNRIAEGIDSEKRAAALSVMIELRL